MEARLGKCRDVVCDVGRVSRETVPVDRPMAPGRVAAQLMREPPPDATLAWLMGELDAPTVVDVSPMPGGSTSAMHRVTLVDRAGRERRVVVLRYALADVVAESPDAGGSTRVGDPVGFEVGVTGCRRDDRGPRHRPSHAALRTLSTYAHKRYDPPRWTTNPGLRERAVELFHGPMSTSDIGFIHRDFNPGNVLWVRDRMTGLVDW